MAGANLLKKAADWDSLATGLEAVDGAISLQVGGGGAWDANSLEMNVLPPSPWISDGTEFAGVVEGQLVEINDTSPAGGARRNFQLLPPNWDEDFSVGFTAYIKMRSLIWTGFNGQVLTVDDGSEAYDIQLKPESIDIIGSSSNNHITGKYIWLEIFISIDSSVASFWIFNTFTNKWDLLRVGLAPDASSVERVLFGSNSSPAFGHGFWDFLRWKSAIEATPFRTTSPVSLMGAVSLPVGFIVNGVGNYRTSIAGSATLKPSINFNNAGFSAAFDSIEDLNIELLANPVEITTATDSLDLRNAHGSNGLEQSQFWPGEGPNLTGTGGGGADDKLIGGSLGAF